MGVFDRFVKPEQRSSLEDPSAPVSAENFLHLMGWGDYASSTGVVVNTETAMGVPAVWAAVNFISGTLASLPLEVYRKTDSGSERVADGIGGWIDRAVNPALSSFNWRKYTYEQMLTGGRSVTLIVRNNSGEITDLVPLDPTTVQVSNTTVDGYPTKSYRTSTQVYAASDIIDLTFMVKHNMLDVRSPLATHRDVIGLSIAASRYGAKAFQAGGIPPAVLRYGRPKQASYFRVILFMMAL